MTHHDIGDFTLLLCIFSTTHVFYHAFYYYQFLLLCCGAAVHLYYCAAVLLLDGAAGFVSIKAGGYQSGPTASAHFCKHSVVFTVIAGYASLLMSLLT